MKKCDKLNCIPDVTLNLEMLYIVFKKGNLNFILKKKLKYKKIFEKFATL